MADSATRRAVAKVEIVTQQFEHYSTLGGGHTLITGAIEEAYVGVGLHGHGSVRALLALGKDGTGRFSNQVHFEGTLGERKGSFVLQGRGWLEGVDLATGAWSAAGADWFVVPGSAGGGLTDLRGEGGMTNDGKDTTITLDYWYEKA